MACVITFGILSAGKKRIIVPTIKLCGIILK